MARKTYPTKNHAVHERSWMELSPATIDQLERELGKSPKTPKDFLEMAGHLVSISLIMTWIKEGANTQAKVIERMRDEYDNRRYMVAASRKRESGDLSKVSSDDERQNDIPF